MEAQAQSLEGFEVPQFPRPSPAPREKVPAQLPTGHLAGARL